MRLQHRIRLAWHLLKHKELQDEIEMGFQNMVDVMNFQKITGRQLSEANQALTLGEIEIKEKDTPHDPTRHHAHSFHYDKPWGTRLGGNPA